MRKASVQPAPVATFLLLWLSMATLAIPGFVSAAQDLAPSRDGSLSLAEAEEMMGQGNLSYQNSAFDEALAAYQAIREAGLESADLYYNLGNAYFKTGDLGRSILSYERALKRRPGDADATANLALARSLTADDIEPMPRFWVLSALSWWVSLIPRVALVGLVLLSYGLLASGLSYRILSRGATPRPWAGSITVASLVGLVIFGSTVLARDGVIGGTEWGIILVEETAVQSAPSAEDDLTLFRIHEGTRVRLDQRTEDWSEVVLEDGRVGWVPSGVLETI